MKAYYIKNMVLLFLSCKNSYKLSLLYQPLFTLYPFLSFSFSKKTSCYVIENCRVLKKCCYEVLILKTPSSNNEYISLIHFHTTFFFSFIYLQHPFPFELECESLLYLINQLLLTYLRIASSRAR